MSVSLFYMLHMQTHTVVSNTHEHSFHWVKSTTTMLFQYCKVNIKSSCSVLSFQLLVTQSQKTLKNVEHPEFGFKNKKVIVHGHVCDVYTVVIGRY